jgi:TonB family protein
MSAKIKFSAFTVLFRLFSFLADKTGGWEIFVKPKLILGTLILSVSMSCNTKGKTTTCYLPMPEDIDNIDIDSASVDSIIPIDTTMMRFDDIDRVSCYEYCYTSMYKQMTVEEDNSVAAELDMLAEKNDSVNGKEDLIWCYSGGEMIPEFPGREFAMREFIRKELIYPDTAIKYNIQGKVYCRFTVNEDGSISNVEIIKGCNTFLDEEAMRVVRSMPKWVSGKRNGRAVKVQYTVPIAFKLTDEQTKK